MIYKYAYMYSFTDIYEINLVNKLFDYSLQNIQLHNLYSTAEGLSLKEPWC